MPLLKGCGGGEGMVLFRHLLHKISLLRCDRGNSLCKYSLMFEHAVRFSEHKKEEKVLVFVLTELCQFSIT